MKKIIGRKFIIVVAFAVILAATYCAAFLFRDAAFASGDFSYKGITASVEKITTKSGIQTNYIAQIPVSSGDIKPYVYFGADVLDRKTMSESVLDMYKNGKRVVFGINADAYNISGGAASGLANGMIIQDSRLVQTPLTDGDVGSRSVGFKADGSSIYETAGIELNVTLSGKTLKIRHLNRDFGVVAGTYLYSYDYNKVLEKTDERVEVRLKSTEGDASLGIGSVQDFTVTAVNLFNVGEAGEPLTGADELKIVCKKGTDDYTRYSRLAAEATVSLSVDSKYSVWKEAVCAVGVFVPLVISGVEQPGVSTDPLIAPRTALGINPDGSVVAFVNDGRQAGYSVGTTFRELVDCVKTELGCVDVINFDGGGSSTFAFYDEESGYARTVNKPSDGGERKNSNYLFFYEDLPVYSVSASGNEGGTVTCDKASVFEGGCATIRISAGQNYEIKGITVNGKNQTLTDGNELIITDIKENTTVSVQFEKTNTDDGNKDPDEDKDPDKDKDPGDDNEPGETDSCSSAVSGLSTASAIASIFMLMSLAIVSKRYSS